MRGDEDSNVDVENEEFGDIDLPNDMIEEYAFTTV